MVNGVLNATISGHTAGITSFTLSFSTTATDLNAQTKLNGAKTFLTNGGATIDSSNGTFTPTSTELS